MPLIDVFDRVFNEVVIVESRRPINVRRDGRTSKVEREDLWIVEVLFGQILERGISEEVVGLGIGLREVEVVFIGLCQVLEEVEDVSCRRNDRSIEDKV